MSQQHSSHHAAPSPSTGRSWYLLSGLVLAAAVAVATLSPLMHASAGDQAKPAAKAAPATAATAAASGAVDAAAAQITPDVAKLLAEIKAGDKEQLAVSPEDGQFLRFLVASTQRKRALEIGSAQGYSAIWIGLAMRETGGKLITIEYDPARAKTAAENVKRAGLSDVVTVIPGDAFKEIPKLTGTFDCVFVDAWKRDYIKFFDMTFPRMDKGGVFLGHNVINKKSEMSDFLNRITTHPDLFSSIVAPSGEGISVSYKKK